MFGMRRREFITLLGGAAAWPFAARAQQPDDRVRALIGRVLRTQAEAAADKIGTFIKTIESKLGWTTQVPWSAGYNNYAQRRFDGQRLLRQVPAIIELAQMDATGKERLRVSRLRMDVVGSGIDFSNDPEFTEATAHKVYYGPVYFRRPGGAPDKPGEPNMTLSVAGTQRDAGVSIAEVGLKLIQDVVADTATKVGNHGVAYIVDAQGRVIAHSDGGLVQRDLSGLAQVQAARAGGAATEPVQVARDSNGREVLTTYAAISPPGWLMFVELPAEEANAPAPTR